MNCIIFIYRNNLKEIYNKYNQFCDDNINHKVCDFLDSCKKDPSELSNAQIHGLLSCCKNHKGIFMVLLIL